MNNAYIHGVYQTKFGELWDREWSDLVQESVEGVFTDASVNLENIDAIYVGSMIHSWTSGQNNLAGLVSETLGVTCPIIPVEVACASGGVAFYLATQAVKSGIHTNILVLGAEKMTDIDSSIVAEALMGAASFEEREAGLTFPGLYAMMSRAYMNAYNLERDLLSTVPVHNHRWAKENPDAQFPFEISLEQVSKSSLVADPLHLLDCSGVTDGAAACIVSSNPSDIEVLSSQMATDTISLHSRESFTSIAATKSAAKKAFSEANLSPDAVDVAEVHDCFSIAQVIAVEDLGFAEQGTGVSVACGESKLAINRSGGLKACGHPVGATGVKQIVELTKQLRSQAGGRQVEKAAYGLAHNVAGSGSAAVVSILGRSS